MIRLFISCIIILLTFFDLESQPYLLEAFPQLAPHIPYISLAELPTPISQLESFGKEIQYNNIFMKRDDYTGKSLGNGLRLYGGNKVRKLEFILADALTNNAKTIITLGCVGSNHALATATYAHALGLHTLLMLTHQPPSNIVRQNLLLDYYYTATLQFFHDTKTRQLAAETILVNDAFAYLIPIGGSNSRGALGFVNAALELAHQIASGEMPAPAVIYIPMGSCGTVAGLLLGMKIVGLHSKVIAVTIEPEQSSNGFLLKTKKLFNNTNMLLHSLDASIPVFDFPDELLMINKTICGTEYGLAAGEVTEAMALFKKTENINLDGTYSARPLVAIMNDIANGTIKNETILFWNTYCGIDFSSVINFNDYTKLPAEFHTYFETYDK